MDQKDLNLLKSYFQTFRELHNYHLNEEEFNKFKAWAEIEPKVHSIFEAFEDFYQQLDAELQSQGVRDAVLEESFDPSTLANPQPIVDIIKSTAGSKSTAGKFLGSLGGDWSKQKLALNNISLHYEVMNLTKEHEDNPDIEAMLIGFTKQYNESMGSLLDVVNGRFDYVDEQFVGVSGKIIQLLRDVAVVSKRTKNVPVLVESVKSLTETVKHVEENVGKVDTVLEVLSQIQATLGEIKDKEPENIDEKLAAFRVALLEDINNLLDERENNKMTKKSFITKTGAFIKKHWFSGVALLTAVGLGLGMGHFIKTTDNRESSLEANLNNAAAVYEQYYGEGTAADLTFEQIMEGLGAIPGESHTQEDIDKMNGYDQAVANYESLMGTLTAEYEKVNGEGSSEGKSITDLLAGLAQSGGDIVTYEKDIVELYDKLFPEGTAENLEDMLTELESISIKTEEEAGKLAEYDNVMASIASTYTDITGGDATGLTASAMLDAIADAIENAGDDVFGRTVMLQLYQNIMGESGESMTNEELYSWVCQFYDLEDTYVKNDHVDTYEPTK